MRPRAALWMVLATVVLLVSGGCGGAVTPTDMRGPDDPASSTLPLTDDDLAVCDGTIRMAQGAQRLRQIRLRKGSIDRLDRAIELVVEGQRLVVEYASARMRNRVRTLGYAVTNASIAVEDFRTTERLDAAASNVKRRVTSLRRAIESFRTWLGCPPPASDSTPPPELGSPDPSDLASQAAAG